MLTSHSTPLSSLYSPLSNANPYPPLQSRRQYYTIFGQWLVYVTPTQQLAQTLGGNANFMFNLVSGFIQPYPAIPVRERRVC